MNAKGEERVSLIVRVGESSPSNAPSRKDLQIDSDIVCDGVGRIGRFENRRWQLSFDFGGRDFIKREGRILFVLKTVVDEVRVNLSMLE